MYEQVEKPKESNSSAVAEPVSQRQHSNAPTHSFVDNRPQAIQMRKLQELAKNSPQVVQLRKLQSIADANSLIQRENNGKQDIELLENRPKAIQMRGLQELTNTSQPKQPVKLPSTPTIQRIASDETGAYIGYTMGGNSPTFYFENGHFTQKHDKPENVGWHPNKGDRHFIKNITQESYDKYEAHRDEKKGGWNRDEKSKFGLEIERGGHDAKEGEGMMVEGDVKIKEGKEKVYLHPSRGRFIKAGDENAEYTEKEAREAVSNGKLAENEQKA